MSCGTSKKLTPALEKEWKPTKKCDRTKLLCIRRPTYISNLKKSIPRPNQRPVKSALPIWEETELNEKICTFHGHTPTGPLVFHRGLMGYDPLKTKSKSTFSLNDPHSREINNEYNPLHDPHLKNWLNSKTNRKFLHKQGLVTENMEVICNLKEYNDYRRFLWRRQNDEMTKLLKLKDQQKIEQLKINTANLNHQKNVANKLKRLKLVMSKEKPKNVS